MPEDAEANSFEKHLAKEKKLFDSFCLILVIKLEKIWTFENKKLSVR